MAINEYCTLAEVRAEGYGDPPFSDARIARAIKLASGTIEDITGLWFGSKDRTLLVDAIGGTILPVNVPIIRIDEIDLIFSVSGVTQDQAIDLNSIQIYNRHLTMGLTAPDDREAPRIELRTMAGGDFFFLQRWPTGPQQVKLVGKFGYTELDSADPVGETEAGSQIPLSFGSIPVVIQDACLRLIRLHLPLQSNSDAVEDELRRWDVKQIETRDQKISYGAATGAAGGSPLGSMSTGDIYVDRVLSRYSRPLAMVMV